MKNLKRRSRIAGLGRPFLITASIGAPAVGCSVSVVQEDADVELGRTRLPDGGQLPTQPEPTVISNPPPPTCPESVPAQGERCSSPQLQCDYGDCYGSPDTEATCGDDGLWSVGIWSCNPPAPQPCPEQMPVQGDPCLGTEPTECVYTGCGATAFECAQGSWTLTSQTTCNPPEPEPEPEPDPDADGGV